MDYIKEFTKTMQSFQYRVDTIKVFSDMCQLGFIAIVNRMRHPKWQEFEDEYTELINHYKKEDRFRMRALLEIAVAGMNKNPYRDILGELYMSLDIANSSRGQVFTPYGISQICANIGLPKDEIDQRIAEKGFISINDPAVGGGSMLLAGAAAINANGYDPAEVACFVGQDIDMRCCHMTYIQCYYNNLAACVLHGNTLSNETPTAYYTPQWVVGNWSEKIQ